MSNPNTANGATGIPLTGAVTGNSALSTTSASAPAAQQPWQLDILRALGAPTTANNVANLNRWNACEGNKAGGSGLPINNPFNTTLPYNGAPGVNSVNVRHYLSYADGIAATVKTITGTKAFAPILAALMNDAPTSVFAAAVGNSGWGTSGGCIAKASGSPDIPQTQGSGSGDTGGATGINVPGEGIAGDVAGAVAGAASWTTTLGNLLTSITSVKFWQRIGIGAGGLLLLLVGAVFILSESKVVTAAVETGAVL